MFDKLRRRQRTVTADAGSSPFRHSPLDTTNREIRLIQVVNARQDEPIEIELHTASLDSPPRFAMISYVWGRTDQMATILCNGQQIAVLPKLLDILRSLYQDRNDGVRYAWTDIICVNQDDHVEKSIQVRLTPLIVRLADVTICWTETSISQPTIEFLLNIADSVQSLRPAGTPWDGLALFQSDSMINENTLTRHPHYDLEEVNRLLDANYFQRAWILPDLVLSKRVILRCTSTDLAWDTLCDALEALVMYGVDPVLNSSGVENVFTANLLRQKYHASGLTLAETLLAVHHSVRRVTSRIDAFYALLGICENAVTPDYRNDVGHAYMEAASVIDQSFKTPLSLTLAGLTTNTSDLPSWVPDLSTAKQRLLLGHPKSNFATSTDTIEQDRRICPQGHRQFFRGSIVDSISFVKSYLPPRRLCDQYRLDGDNLYCFVQWYESLSVADGWAEGRASDALQLRFVETIQARGCNSIWEQRPLPSEEETVRQGRAFLDFLQDPDTPVTNELRIFNAACSPSHDRRFGMTGSGKLCLLPFEAQVGDLVCVVSGLKVPLILRPRPTQDLYQNVGEAYVHGIMKGERCDEVQQELALE